MGCVETASPLEPVRFRSVNSVPLCFPIARGFGNTETQRAQNRRRGPVQILDIQSSLSTVVIHYYSSSITHPHPHPLCLCASVFPLLRLVLKHRDTEGTDRRFAHVQNLDIQFSLSNVVVHYYSSSITHPHPHPHPLCLCASVFQKKRPRDDRKFNCTGEARVINLEKTSAKPGKNLTPARLCGKPSYIT